ncbi:MAG: DUF1015 domain-containing protein [Nitrospinae bacterium]|nr:DUF1015 domain-containing protein [Nitrospinota bacterium]
MVEVVPFRGLLFDQEKTGPLAEVTAPPYDVIKPEQQEELYRKNPYNVVRLILGKELPSDHENDNRYTRSAALFRQWTEEGALVRDHKPVFYLYSQGYPLEGSVIQRLGFFARVRLEDFDAGNICPHEFTLAKAKADRRRLLQACKANFSPVFGLYSDPKGEIDGMLEAAVREKPMAVIEENSITHRFWRLEDEGVNASLSRKFSDKKIFIADGHHRYETALAYYKENRGGVKDCAHVMFFLTNLDAPSLLIFPIHRQARCPFPFNREEFLARLCNFFELSPLPNDTPPDRIKSILEETGKTDIAFCVYLRKGLNRLFLAKLTDARHILPYLDPDDSQELLVLDVAQLHALVIKPLLRIDTKDARGQRYLSYTIHIDEAMRNVDAGEFDLAFLMNPTRISQVKALAEKGIRLPQKSTYFYPKLLSGLAINPFDT